MDHLSGSLASQLYMYHRTTEQTIGIDQPTQFSRDLCTVARQLGGQEQAAAEAAVMLKMTIDRATKQVREMIAVAETDEARAAVLPMVTELYQEIEQATEQLEALADG